MQFNNSTQWIRYHLDREGVEWVRSNYNQSVNEVPNPCSRKSFNDVIAREIRNHGIESKIKVGDYPGKLDTSCEKKYDDNNLEITTKSLNLRTVEDLIEYSEVDMTEWRVKSHESNSWEVTMGANKTPSGKPETYTNYQVKARFEKRPENSIENVLQEFINKATNYSPVYPKLKRKELGNSKMIEVSIPDLHYGLLSWGRETLDSDYDIKISEKLFMQALEYLLLSVKDYNIEKFLFPIGNDFFNVNSALNTTFKGTPQSEDDRWKKCFSSAWGMLVKAIEMMTSIADVDVIIVPGNHDYERTYYLGEVLYAWFYSNENVSIDNSPSTKKFYLYGNNLIGFMHQFRKSKIAELPLIMADTVPDLWAKSKFREIHTAHIHQEKVDEVRSTKIISLPSLVPASEWSSNEGYGHLREAQCQVWDKEKGKIATNYYYAPKEM